MHPCPTTSIVSVLNLLLMQREPMQSIEIRIKGQIDPSWSDWLGGMAISHTKNGETIIAGSVRDQSALYGLLFRFSSLGFQLLSLTIARGGPRSEEGNSM
jgi:hypothetical protein